MCIDPLCSKFGTPAPVIITSLFFYYEQFEDAAKEVADEITRPRPVGEEDVEDIQVMLTSASNACGIRELKVCTIVANLSTDL